MLLSTAAGMTLVSSRLNPGRAITLCCTANSDSNPRSIASAVGQGSVGPESSDFGTTMFPRNPIA